MLIRKVPASSSALRMTAGEDSRPLGSLEKMVTSAALSVLLLLPVSAPAKEQLGGNFKVLQGAASTQDSGSRRTITRGAVLDRSDFSNQNLAGVSFQVQPQAVRYALRSRRCPVACPSLASILRAVGCAAKPVPRLQL